MRRAGGHPGIVASPERNSAGDGSARDARRAAKLSQQVIEECACGFGRILGPRQRYLRGQQMIGLKADLRSLEPPETLGEQGGSYDEHGRHAELDYDEGLAHEQPSRGGCASTFFQRVTQV